MPAERNQLYHCRQRANCDGYLAGGICPETRLLLEASLHGTNITSDGGSFRPQSFCWFEFVVMPIMMRALAIAHGRCSPLFTGAVASS
eukprot:6754789-Karenia_brevis.AAC.1